MNGTTDTADLLWEMSDARMRESELDELARYVRESDTVSNDLGVYFLFCLFGLAILALFLCRSSMQALQTSLLFFVLGRHVWQVFKSGCLKISTRGRKNKIFEKSQKNYVDSPRYSSSENINFSFIG